MPGFLTIFLIVVLTILFLLFQYLAAYVDARLSRKRERAYRRQWLKQWRKWLKQWRKDHPGEFPEPTMQRYIDEHKLERPVKRPRPKRKEFHFERPFHLLALASLVILFLLFYHAYFVVDNKGAVFYLMLGVIAVIVLWQFIGIAEEKALPHYARTAHHRHDPVKPIQYEREYTR